LDTFEKLLKLGLKDKQDREIVYVLVHCCIHEKIFNPYYVHLAVKLCTYNHNFKFSFQLSFWDKIKALETLPLKSVSNMATFVAELVGHFVLSLTALKLIDFCNLTARQILFLRLFFIHLFDHFQKEVITSILRRILSANKVIGLREGLVHFFLREQMHFESQSNAQHHLSGSGDAKKTVEINMTHPETSSTTSDEGREISMKMKYSWAREILQQKT